MYCTSCGKEIENNSKYCVDCGERINPENENYIHKKPHNDEPRKKNYAVLSVIIAIVVGGLIYASNYNSNDSYNNQSTGTNNYTSRSALIEKTVKELKNEFGLPYKLDESTTLVNITAQTDAIRYHYILSGLDVNTLSSDSIKNFILPGICSDTDILYTLNSGINLEYSYIVFETSETYFFTVYSKDCN